MKPSSRYSLSTTMRVLGALATCATCSTSSCGGGFDAPSKIESVRILASRADKPYAAPGDTVNVEVLAYDARPTKPEPMRISWLPTPCINPKNDAYYGCFAALAGLGAPQDGGAGAGPRSGGGLLAPGVDLTPFLPSGPTFSFTMPADIIAKHVPAPGAPAPYGLAIVFNIACAGHLEFVAIQSDNPQTPPIGCFDQNHNPLGSDDYVLGFTRVYSYATLTNANPVIDHVEFLNAPADPSAGLTVTRCAQDSSGTDCPANEIDVIVPPSSQELNPGDTDANGVMRHEQIWVDYFATEGQFGSDARLLYDAASGQVSGTANKYFAPNDPATGTLWVVAHDNRGGTNWEALPLHVQ